MQHKKIHGSFSCNKKVVGFKRNVSKWNLIGICSNVQLELVNRSRKLTVHLQIELRYIRTYEIVLECC